MENEQKSTKKKGKSKWKTIGLVFLGLFLLAGGLGIYGYNKYKPDNHFKTVPVIGDEPREVPANGVFNVLLLGSDARKEGDLGHTDSMMLVHVDLNQKKYSMMSIPRDTRVYLDGVGYTKITSAHYMVQAQKGLQGGIDEAVKQVSKLTGLEINYYAETSFWGFQDIINTIGGITMNVPFDVPITAAWYPENKGKVITAGTHYLDGKMVTEITRQRYSVPGTDFGRQRLQAEAILGAVRELSDTKNLSKLPDIIKAFPNYLLATNVTTEDMLSLALAATGFSRDQVEYIQIPGHGVNGIYNDALKANDWEYVVDREQLKKIVDEHFTVKEELSSETASQ